jgi:hypothetical protein
VQQRAIVVRALLARVPQRLIAIRPLLVLASPKVPRTHELLTTFEVRRFLAPAQCERSDRQGCAAREQRPGARNPTVLKRLLRRIAG